MSELQKQQHNIDNSEVLEEDSKQPIQNAIFNQQNNYHLIQNIDIEKLTILSDKNADLANRVMCIYENQQKHNIKMDENILLIEKKEQELRLQEIPFQRKFAFRALNFAMSLSIISLITSGVFAYLGYPYLAAIAISIPIGVAVANMLGFKSTSQKITKEEDK